MFLAKLGSIPQIFKDNSLYENWYKLMNLDKKGDRVFLSNILACCQTEKNEHLLPNLGQAKNIYYKGASKNLMVYKIIQTLKKYRKKIKLMIT